MRRHFSRSKGRRRRVFLGQGDLCVRAVQATGITLSWFQRKNVKSTFRMFAIPSWVSAICNHFGDIAAWSPKSLKIFPEKLPFSKKTPYGEIFKILFRKDSPPYGSMSCVQISWNLADRKSVKSRVAYQKKISARSVVLASARIAPKICQGQLQTM